MLTIKLQRYGDKFEKLRQQLPGKANAIVDKHTDATVDLMKQLSPVDTGFMRGSIEKVVLGPLTLGIRIGAPYAVFVELGTIHMEAQPFISPAVESGRAGYLEELKQALRELANG